jgi:hypothetical protein
MENFILNIKRLWFVFKTYVFLQIAKISIDVDEEKKEDFNNGNSKS